MSIARRDILLKEMSAIQLANEKRVAQAQQVIDAVTNFDEVAVIQAAKTQLSNQLLQAKTILDSALVDAINLTDVNGRYKELFEQIDVDAADNPHDLVAQYQKQMKDGLIAHAEEYKTTISSVVNQIKS